MGITIESIEFVLLITAAFGVVAFSIFVQGFTMTPLLRWLQELSAYSAGAAEKQATKLSRLYRQRVNS